MCAAKQDAQRLSETNAFSYFSRVPVIWGNFPSAPLENHTLPSPITVLKIFTGSPLVGAKQEWLLERACRMWHKVTCKLSDSGASDVHRQSIGPCLPFEVAAEAGAFRVLGERFVPCNTLNISSDWRKIHSNEEDTLTWRHWRPWCENP